VDLVFEVRRSWNVYHKEFIHKVRIGFILVSLLVEHKLNF